MVNKYLQTNYNISIIRENLHMIPTEIFFCAKINTQPLICWTKDFISCEWVRCLAFAVDMMVRVHMYVDNIGGVSREPLLKCIA